MRGSARWRVHAQGSVARYGRPQERQVEAGGAGVAGSEGQEAADAPMRTILHAQP